MLGAGARGAVLFALCAVAEPTPSSITRCADQSQCGAQAVVPVVLPRLAGPGPGPRP